MVIGELAEQTDVAVLGGGPGGYVAAFKAADLGLNVTLIDENEQLGGVCLREGCIPSKALLNLAHLVVHAREAAEHGISFGEPKIEIDKVRHFKEQVVDRLCGGVNTLAGKRNVRVVHGRGRFEDSRTLRIEGGDVASLKFKHAVVATGSVAKRLPEKIMPADCVSTAREALKVAEVPKKMLVVGGGYIGIELGQVYAGFGSQVSVVEMLDRILAGADADLARPLIARLKRQFAAIHTSAKLEGAKRTKKGVEVTFSVDGEQQKEVFDQVLVSVGRAPNTNDIGIENTKATVNDRGFIEVNEQLQTSDKRIFAIGDVAGDPMLAHKASREGIVAAEVIAGHNVVFDNRAIPAVVYTSPELAWVGVTEDEAKQQGLNVKVGKFPWGASGRAIAIGRPEGLTKIIADAESQRVLGVGIVGEHAGDLISEAALAIEMGAIADDIAMTIHPHPATSETLMEAAEGIFGKAIHVAR